MTMPPGARVVAKRAAAIVLWLIAAPGALAAGDAKRGAQVFRQCMACHSTASGEHMTGPSLAHVWGHKAATVEGFARLITFRNRRRCILGVDAKRNDKVAATPNEVFFFQNEETQSNLVKSMIMIHDERRVKGIEV